MDETEQNNSNPPRNITYPGCPQTADDATNASDLTINEPEQDAESPISAPSMLAETGVK